MKDGYEIIRNALPATMIAEAKRIMLLGEPDEQGHMPREIKLHPAIVNIARWLHAKGHVEYSRLHMPPMARCIKPGNAAAAVPAHQDIAYNRHMERFVTAWVPLVKIDDDCGGMAVYPGSHLWGEVPLQETWTRDGPWLHGITVNVPGERLQMSPGDAVLMHPLLIHESLPNKSDHDRLSLDFRFFTGRSSKPFIELVAA